MILILGGGWVRLRYDVDPEVSSPQAPLWSGVVSRRDVSRGAPPDHRLAPFRSVSSLPCRHISFLDGGSLRVRTRVVSRFGTDTPDKVGIDRCYPSTRRLRS